MLRCTCLVDLIGAEEAAYYYTGAHFYFNKVIWKIGVKEGGFTTIHF